MNKWMLVCPNCKAHNEAVKETVTVKCGEVSFRGKCMQCGHELEGHQDYTDWLARAEESASGNDSSQGQTDQK